jgi:nitroreductase
MPTIAASDVNPSTSLSQVLAKRYSGYSYDASRPVIHEVLLEVLEAGRLAPSSYNEQPWHFIVCDRDSDPEAFKKAVSILVEFNQQWAKNAPVLILAVAANKFSHNDKYNRWAQYDTGAAAFSMSLKASSAGLMAHQIGGFDEQKAKHVFSIPENFEVMSMLAIGYPSSEETQPERKRKPLENNFFKGNWNSKFE